MSAREAVLREKLERAIVTRLVKDMAKIGWKPVETYDDGEYVPTTSLKAVLATVFSVDMSTISFKKDGRVKGVLIVCGNGEDCISDYHCGDDAFNAVIEAIYQLIERGAFHVRVAA